MAIALLTITGWVTGMAAASLDLPNWSSMNPLTAFCFLLTSICLWYQRNSEQQGKAKILVRCLATVVGLISLFTIFEYVFILDLGLDRWIITQESLGINGKYVGQMSPNSAIAFLLGSGSFWLLSYDSPQRQRLAQQLAFFVGMLAWLALLGYAYRINASPTFPGMSLYTAITLLIFSSGLLCVYPDRGLMALLTSDSAGGFLVRRLLPAALVVPSLLGWIQLMGQWTGYYNSAFGTSLLASLNILVFIIVIWRNAATLHQVDLERQQAEALLRITHLDLEQKVEQRTRALQQSETLKKSVLDALPQHLAVLDCHGTIIEVNSAWKQFAMNNGGAEPGCRTGVGANYLEACRSVSGDEEASSRHVINGLEAVLSGQESMFTLEYPCHSPTEKRWFLLTAVPLPRETGGAVVAHANITQQKLSGDALRNSNEMLRRLQSVTDTAFSQLSLSRLIPEMLARVCESLQADAAALWLLDKDAQLLSLQGAIGINYKAEGELKIPLSDSLTGSIALRKQPVIIDDLDTMEVNSLGLHENFKSLIGVPLLTENRVIGVIHATTKNTHSFTEEDGKLLQLAADRIAVTIERARLYESEQNARIRAEEASRMKDEFLAVVSHELRSPLNAILGWATLLRGGKLNAADISRAVDTIERSARAQNRIVSDLLDVSRIISGKLRLNIRTLELPRVIESAVEALIPAAEAKSIRLQTILDPAAGPVSGDADRLQQVVWNLVSNAIRFTAKGGEIQIRLARVNSHVEIVVSDNGIGINPEFLPYVFDRFRQADSSSTRRTGGLGLGLSIVRHLVELHGGQVTVESRGEGQGATFTVTLPILIGHRTQLPVQRVQPTMDTPTKLDCPPVLDDLHVLVVDDEADTRELITTILTSCGADVRGAASAKEALTWLSSESIWKPELLISDIEMPITDGYALIRRVREQEKSGMRLPAIALTAYARVEDRLRALGAGFQMHVPKPVEPAELLTVVASLSGRLSQKKKGDVVTLTPGSS